MREWVEGFQIECVLARSFSWMVWNDVVLHTVALEGHIIRTAASLGEASSTKLYDIALSRKKNNQLTSALPIELH